ncbi:response regulator [Pseudaminobacter sp. 19-2017]|uniref:Response regulator n=1 Tax=Pseudaminobacter soli (ex Zhang et al. 2022) TaxID=2831468 RepID=A0A942I432_9HYPH|nr:response regulator [Pseudaminobacter soli]MBS3650824.1 response regulator [Pseudaminobacter soli]
MKRCMFVDDSSVVRKVAKRILNGPDMIVIEAESGLDAVDMCQAEMPDIVIVASALPDLPAADVVRRIRSIPSPIVPHIAVCLTELDIPTIMRAKRAGAQSYLLKPFNRTQLLEFFRAISEPKPTASAA